MELLERVLRRPTAMDDKYSRGVVGFVSGSTEYPGAAILGVTAAIRTGIGMVRYLGPDECGRLLLEVRPEVVLQDGRVQCWVVGSGVANTDRGEQARRILNVLQKTGFAIIDAGALAIADFDVTLAQSILTPHAGELSSLLARFGSNLTRQEIELDPIDAAKKASILTNQVVLLKGNITIIADPQGGIFQTEPSNPALATAGSGDVLAGILGALVAQNVSYLEFGDLTLSEIALAAAMLHAQAGDLAAEQGPVAALDIAEAVRTIVKAYVF